MWLREEITKFKKLITTYFPKDTGYRMLVTIDFGVTLLLISLGYYLKTLDNPYALSLISLIIVLFTFFITVIVPITYESYHMDQQKRNNEIIKTNKRKLTVIGSFANMIGIACLLYYLFIAAGVPITILRIAFTGIGLTALFAGVVGYINRKKPPK